MPMDEKTYKEESGTQESRLKKENKCHAEPWKLKEDG